MDANRIQEQSKELVQKLLSADASDVEDAVNQYFKKDATLITSSVHVVGADKIKKLGKMNSWTRSKPGQVTEKPKYDEKSKTIRYSSTMAYTSPQLPSYIPLSAQLSGFQSKLDWNFVAHLTGENGDKKLYVKKLEAKRRDPSVIDRAIPPFILRPVATFISLTAVAIVTFIQTHKGEGVLGFILAAMIEVVNTMWSMIAPEVGRRQEQAENWRQEKVPQIKEYLQQASSNALDTASKVQADLESRAKSAGIPIDDYKSRASTAFADLTENVEARAKAAGIPVAEYKEKAEEIIEELRKRAGEVGGYLEGKAGEAKEKAGEVQKEAGKKAGEVQKQAGKKMGEVQEKAGEVQKEAGKKAGEAQEKAGDVAKDAQKKADGAAKQTGKQDKRTRQDSNNVTQDSETIVSTGAEAGHLSPDDQRAKEIRAEFEATPKTPLGGHDPTAPNAPSFAAAAAI